MDERLSMVNACQQPVSYPAQFLALIRADGHAVAVGHQDLCGCVTDVQKRHRGSSWCGAHVHIEGKDYLLRAVRIYLQRIAPTLREADEAQRHRITRCVLTYIRFYGRVSGRAPPTYVETPGCFSARLYALATEYGVPAEQSPAVLQAVHALERVMGATVPDPIAVQAGFEAIATAIDTAEEIEQERQRAMAAEAHEALVREAEDTRLQAQLQALVDEQQATFAQQQAQLDQQQEQLGAVTETVDAHAEVINDHADHLGQLGTDIGRLDVDVSQLVSHVNTLNGHSPSPPRTKSFDTPSDTGAASPPAPGPTCFETPSQSPRVPLTVLNGTDSRLAPTPCDELRRRAQAFEARAQAAEAELEALRCRAQTAEDCVQAAEALASLSSSLMQSAE